MTNLTDAELLAMTGHALMWADEAGDPADSDYQTEEEAN